MAGDKNVLAEDRTDLAEDRTVLANERTFAGWLRTGLAAVGVGVGFNALFGTLRPEWAPKAIATAFTLVGAATFVLAAVRAVRTRRRLDAHQVARLGSGKLVLLSGALTASALALAAAYWLLA